MAANDKKAAAAQAAKSAPAKTAALEGDLVLLVAKEPIRLDGRDLPPGKTFSAAPEDAAALMASGAADTAADVPAEE